MKKRAITRLMTPAVLAAMLLTQPAYAATTIQEFSDYTSQIQNKWSESYIATLVSKGGIKGYEDGTFRPKANITTAELLSLIINTAGKKADTSNWPQSVMNQANELGLVDSSMMSEGNKPIPREKMAHILVAAAQMLGENTSSVPLVDASRIPDLNKASNEYQGDIRLAYSMGLLAGNDDAGTFKPSSSTTREETCVIINRLFKYTDRVDVHKPKPEVKPEKPEVKPEQPKPDVKPGKPGGGKWDISDFQFGNSESEKYNDPNVYIGDRTGAIYPKEGDIGPNGKPITRDPVTGVLGFGNGQKGGIYLNKTYIATDGGPNFEIKVNSEAMGDKIRGMTGMYRKRGNYVYWEGEWNWIEGAATDNLNATRGKVPHGAYADIHGNVYKGNDIEGEAFYKYDANSQEYEDGKGAWRYIKRNG